MDKLPNEILDKILLYLDYFDLKRCIRVSKTFQAITKLGGFDFTLFRSKKVIPEDEYIQMPYLSFHPVFNYIDYYEEGSLESALLLLPGEHRWDEKAGSPLIGNSVAREQATSPPISYIRLKPFGDKNTVEVKNKYGVTIVQLFEGLCRYLAGPREPKFLSMEILLSWVSWSHQWKGQDAKVLCKDFVLGAYWEG